MWAVFHLFPSQHFCSFPTGETGILCDIVIYLSSASREYFSTAGVAGGSTRGNEFLSAARTNPNSQTSVYTNTPCQKGECKNYQYTNFH